MMREEIQVYSDGTPLDATIHRPDDADHVGPIVVHAIGWMSSRRASHYQPYYQALTAAGLTVMSFDYRMISPGASAAPRIRFDEQLSDLRSVVDYAAGLSPEGRPSIGLLGTGGVGAALALQAAAGDARVSCVAALWPIADGARWLLSLRTPQERRKLVAEVAENAIAMARGNPDREVDVSYVVPRPQDRAQAGFKVDLEGSLPTRIGLSTAASFRAVRPIDTIARISPRATLLIGCEDDVIVPFENAQELYDAAQAPKRLVQLRDTTSYRAYETHFDELSSVLIEWFDSYAGSAPRKLREWHDS